MNRDSNAGAEPKIERIRRLPQETGYFLQSCLFVQDMSMSTMAKGLAGIIQSLPEDFSVTKAFITNKVPEGRRAVEKAWAELVERGYLTKKEVRSAGGKFAAHEWIWDPNVINQKGGFNPEFQLFKRDKKAQNPPDHHMSTSGHVDGETGKNVPQNGDFDGKNLPDHHMSTCGQVDTTLPHNHMWTCGALKKNIDLKTSHPHACEADPMGQGDFSNVGKKDDDGQVGKGDFSEVIAKFQELGLITPHTSPPAREEFLKLQKQFGADLLIEVAEDKIYNLKKARYIPGYLNTLCTERAKEMARGKGYCCPRDGCSGVAYFDAEATKKAEAKMGREYKLARCEKCKSANPIQHMRRVLS